MKNEKRLIDANALSDLLDVEYKRKMKLVCKGEIHLDNLAEGITSVAILLGTMPTVDAVEVVRCKDCKYKRHNKHHDVVLCDHPNGRRHLLNPMDFCSDGERTVMTK